MTSTSDENNLSEMTARPANVYDLLHESEINSGWRLANRDRNRFFVANIRAAIDELLIKHTRANSFFERAKNLLAETEWQQQYLADWSCSRTQIYPEKRYGAKRFEHAVMIILAIEAAAELCPHDFDVYRHLRIVPATYHIEGLDADLLQTYRNADEEFDKKLLMRTKHLGQPDIVDQVFVKKNTMTRFVAEEWHAHLSRLYPNIPLGPVSNSGDDGDDEGGRGNAAPDLRIPRLLNVNEA